ncbi:MAG: hypothetical protein PHQ89_05195 [Bacilli bacterium]|nr:hypothetical protein [Bacilli bacterium]
MKRNSEGSTLIVGIIIFTFVIIVMTAMLSMIVGNYKARASESKRVENLYGAESGLDVAYNIIGQTFNAAVAYGKNKVTELGNGASPNRDYERLINDINHWQDSLKDQTATSEDKKEYRKHISEDNTYIELLKNEEFKRAFKEFLYDSKSNDLDETKNTENVDELAKSILGKKYIVDRSESENNGRYQLVNFNRNNGEQDPTLLVYDDKNPTQGLDPNKDKSGIHYTNGVKDNKKSVDNKKLADGYPLNIPVLNNQECIVKVTSNFETISANEPNLRAVQATYTIKVPDYMQSLKTYSIFNNKSLVVGKNMNINNINNFNVNGDVFVQGEMKSEDETGEIAYDKYLGGIKIDKSKNVNFNDNVITRSTFNVIDDFGVKVKKNLYARNVYAGKGKDFASGLGSDNSSTLDIANDLVVDNDLTLKAKNTNITIGNFYGINSYTINDKDDAKKRNSSSIIVNKDESDEKNPFTSSIHITDEVWIMGVAYINTVGSLGKYETGESVGVKGNYKAYSENTGSDVDSNISFSYYDPLQLMDGNLIQKSEHFRDYWNDSNNKNHIDPGGVTLSGDSSKIHSIGAIFDGTQVQYNYHMEDSLGVIPEKKRDYATKVYKIGEATATDDDYTNGEDSATDVSELMDLSNIDYSLKDQVKKSEKAIFNKEDRKVIIRECSGDDSIEGLEDPKSDIIINAKDGILNAVIATAGDVEIDQNVTFNGSIITNGNLDIKGDGITINKDSDVVKKVQAENIDLFESVFKDGKYDVSNTEDYDLSSYLANKLWKIIK